MNSSKKQEISSLVVKLKQQINPLIADESQWHPIEIDLVKDTLRKLYELLVYDSVEIETPNEIAETVVIESITKTEPEIDQEVEELIDVSENEFKLLFELEPVEPKEKAVEKPTLFFEPVDEQLKTPDAEVAQPQPEVAAVKEEIIPEPQPVEDIISEKVEKDSNQVVVEKVAPKSTEKTLGENIVKNPIESLKKYIGINDKFQFINELFDGKMKIYNDKISEIDQLTTLNEAIEIVNQLKADYRWDEESKVYEQFFNYLTRRFSGR